VGRTDISTMLVHFTKGMWFGDDEGAFASFKSIVDKRVLRGSGRLVKGGFPCVCFSEAPLSFLSNGLRNEWNGGNYSPFGVMFEKTWLFARGGRPVIYEPDAEYELLPEFLRWRHVEYQPTGTDHPVDFTWEREWRIQLEELPFGPSDATIVVPTAKWADRLVREFKEQEAHMAELYSEITSSEQVQQACEGFHWRLEILHQ
jgi:hypothetical protein